MTLRGIPTPPGRGSGPNRTNNQTEIVTSSVSKTVDLTDYGLISSLQTQLAQAQADLAQAQAALSAAQAQIAADAITIAALQAQVASLTAQVTSLQAQIAALQNPIYYRFISTTITASGGGIYVPPYFNDPVIALNGYYLPPKMQQVITKVGGGFP